MDWWNELAEMWWDGERKSFPTNPKVEHYYRNKHAIAKRLKPKRICEIGVRAGYSAFAFLSACHQAEFIGLDNNGNAHGGVSGLFTDLAPKILREFNVNLVLFDSQRNNELYGGKYDFIHIDGDHSYKGCLHDMEISHKVCEWILVDDYDFLRGVRRAVDKFLADHPEYTSEHIKDNHRGNMLIHTTFRRTD